MDDALKGFRRSFRLDELTILENAHWVVSVRPEQLTLGSLVVSARDGALHFSELGPEQGASMVEAFAFSEVLLKEAYQAVRINVICLMMKDPIVHFHVIPRYESLREFHGRTWRDEDWPGPPTIRPMATDFDILLSIKNALSTPK